MVKVTDSYYYVVVEVRKCDPNTGSDTVVSRGTCRICDGTILPREAEINSAVLAAVYLSGRPQAVTPSHVGCNPAESLYCGKCPECVAHRERDPFFGQPHCT